MRITQGIKLMFKKLLPHIPFTKENKERKRLLGEAQVKSDLYLLRDSFENAFSYKEVFELFERILNNPSTDLSNKYLPNKSTKVSFLTKTSQNALDLIYRQLYDIESIRRSEYVSFTKPERRFIEWESNQQSIFLFYSFMKEMVHKAVILEGVIELNTIGQNAITHDEELFINSILFRYLCSDLIQLLILYMEEAHEVTERESNSETFKTSQQ